LIIHNPPLNQTSILDTSIDELTKPDLISEVDYQHIIYYMSNPGKVVRSKDMIPIDFIKATTEMKNLDWNYELNYIGFKNKKTNECVQFIRQGQDKWYAEVPIIHGKGWDGYAWCSYSDSKTIVNTMKLFFEEVLWFGMLSWKMRRYKK